MEKESLDTLFSGRLRRVVVMLVSSAAAYIVLTAFVLTTLQMRVTMIWNLFLAGLPLVFAVAALLLYDRFKVLSVILLGLWLMFFPNAPYMLTDFIHLDMYRFYERGVGFLPEVYSWVGFVHILAGVLIGVLMGYLSLYLLQNRIFRRSGRAISWVFVTGVSVLSGIAIYLGRFIRLNSWNLITHPSLVADVMSSLLHADFFKLVLIFAVMIFVTYLPFYVIAEPVIRKD